MPITQPTYPKSVIAVVDHVGAYTDAQVTTVGKVTVATSRNFALSDVGKLLVCTAAVTLTMPSTGIAWPDGAWISTLRRFATAGTVTYAGSVASRGGLLTLAGDRAEATLTMLSAADWNLSGDLA